MKVSVGPPGYYECAHVQSITMQKYAFERTSFISDTLRVIIGVVFLHTIRLKTLRMLNDGLSVSPVGKFHAVGRASTSHRALGVDHFLSEIPCALLILAME
jgi:hypothetical protein